LETSVAKSSEEDNHDHKNSMSAPTIVTEWSRRYADMYPLRAAVQAIPALGGSLDMMLSGLGAKWQMERFEAFVSELDRRLSAVETQTAILPPEPSEPLYDFIMQTISEVIRTRSVKKREAFAAIVTRQAVRAAAWDEAESAVELVGQLSELEFEILRLAETSKKAISLYQNYKTYKALQEPDQEIDRATAELTMHFGSTPFKALYLACAALIAKGLVEDAGVGTLGGRPMTTFAITEGGRWILDWIRDDPPPSMSKLEHGVDA